MSKSEIITSLNESAKAVGVALEKACVPCRELTDMQRQRIDAATKRLAMVGADILVVRELVEKDV